MKLTDVLFDEFLQGIGQGAYIGASVFLTTVLAKGTWIMGRDTFQLNIQRLAQDVTNGVPSYLSNRGVICSVGCVITCIGVLATQAAAEHTLSVVEKTIDFWRHYTRPHKVTS